MLSNPATPHIYTLALHDALPIFAACERLLAAGVELRCAVVGSGPLRAELEAEVARRGLGERVRLLGALPQGEVAALDRKSTRLNSSHLVISYAVFCLKKK